MTWPMTGANLKAWPEPPAATTKPAWSGWLSLVRERSGYGESMTLTDENAGNGDKNREWEWK